MVGFGYTWNDLVQRPVAELAVGDVFVSPGRLAMWTSRDGSVSGEGLLAREVGSVAWTVVERDADRMTIRDDCGSPETTIPGGKGLVLAVLPKPTRAEVRRRRQVIAKAVGLLEDLDADGRRAVLATIPGFDRKADPDQVIWQLSQTPPGDGARARSVTLVAEQIVAAAAKAAAS